MAGGRKEDRQVTVAKRALRLVTQAMDLLDAHGVAPDAAANLAVAQQRLRQVVAS
jgi:hypothetical protein